MAHLYQGVKELFLSVPSFCLESQHVVELYDKYMSCIRNSQSEKYAALNAEAASIL